MIRAKRFTFCAAARQCFKRVVLFTKCEIKIYIPKVAELKLQVLLEVLYSLSSSVLTKDPRPQKSVLQLLVQNMYMSMLSLC